IVVRGRSQAAIDAAGAEVQAMIDAIRQKKDIAENHSAEA
ncbi:competence/damage-inducible protein A, partial [Rhizobium ruizarguesonis]